MINYYWNSVIHTNQILIIVDIISAFDFNIKDNHSSKTVKK